MNFKDDSGTGVLLDCNRIRNVAVITCPALTWSARPVASSGKPGPHLQPAHRLRRKRPSCRKFNSLLQVLQA